MNTSAPQSSPVPRRKRRSFTPEQIRKHVVGLRSSGLSIAAYTRQEGLSYTTVLNWLKRQNSGRRAIQNKFQSMPISSLLSQAWAAEIVGATGLIVRLSAQVPPALVVQLIALASRPC